MCADRDCGSCAKQHRQAARLIAGVFAAVFAGVFLMAHIAGIIEGALIALATIGALTVAGVYVWLRFLRPAHRGQIPHNRLSYLTMRSRPLDRQSARQIAPPQQTAEFHFHTAEASEAFVKSMKGEL